MDVGSAPAHQKYKTVFEEHDRPTNRDALIAKVAFPTISSRVEADVAIPTFAQSMQNTSLQ